MGFLLLLLYVRWGGGSYVTFYGLGSMVVVLFSLGRFLYVFGCCFVFVWGFWGVLVF